ncbi:hydroxyacylglutathione hydrolase [Planctomycetales bacterium]|nr:hydroxyacylglutathione hydrolase [Planctomycetales bacterium]GHT03170.1 hydroxyacylglutathione hydrolase [Planctomycetales bacterium]
MSAPQIIALPTGVLSVNTYLVVHGDEALVIDPGGDAPEIIRQLGDAKMVALLLTHSHYDHLGAVNEMSAAFPAADYYCHPRCAVHAASAAANFSAEICGEKYAVAATAKPLNGGETLKLAGLKMQTFFVPGHTDDSLCFYFPDAAALFSGDTVFAGSVGRSDLPGGNGGQLIREIKKMLAVLPTETAVYPGHGEPTTVAVELQSNPFFQS